MDTKSTLASALARLFSELVDGPAADGAYMLNSGDPGLLNSLDRLSAAAASQKPTPDGASIAAHVDHVCYGIELMNRWSGGNPDPWSGADWAASWKRTSLDDGQWAALRNRLREQCRQWHDALQRPREMSLVDMNTVIGTIAHLGYHLGAIRQIDRSIQGPKAEEAA
jgi:DinB superfamily